MSFMGLKKADRRKLETEVISNDARLRLTRLMRKACNASDTNINLIRSNRFINMSRTLLGMTIYRLEPDDLGMYMNEEFGWHLGEAELVMRRPDTAQLVELLGDLLQEGMLDLGTVNEILAEDNVSVRFKTKGFEDDVAVEFLALDELVDESGEDEHPNIRLLVTRMDEALERSDYPAVLHASASVFETLAKLVFNTPSVENETLGGIFSGYRNRSSLPGPILDFILETYNRRNTEPLAGHGRTKAPTLSAAEAAVLVELTKSCVRLERRLVLQEQDRGSIQPKPEPKPAPKGEQAPTAALRAPGPPASAKAAGKARLSKAKSLKIKKRKKD
jgi:hypothetical protein